MTKCAWILRGLSLALLPVALSAGLSGCADSALSAGDLESGDDDSYPGVEPTPSPDDGGYPTPPPETGDAFYRAAPASSDRYVFVVNPDRDTLSKINASTRAVYTLPVGVHPTQVLVGAKDPGKAVVLNEGSAELSIVDTATDAIQTVPIHKDTNFMRLSDDGLYAITWFNAAVEGADTSVDGERSYSNISVVFTGDKSHAPTSTPIAVALNPRDAAFVPQTSQALVLCDNAVAQISLSATPTSRLITLTDDIDEELQVSELKVSPDGHFAFLRLANVPDLIVIDLTADLDSAVSRLSLDDIPTDMDLSGNSLIVVDRTNRTLQVFQALDPSAPPKVVPTPSNQIVGSVAVAPEVDRAILYTTLTAKDIKGTELEGIPLNRFSVWNLETDDIKLYELVKPVEAVTINHNPGMEVVTFIHDGAADSDVQAFDNKDAFSNYYFSDSLVVPTVLAAPIKAIADTPDGVHEFMILEDNPYVVIVDYLSRQVDAVQVQSQPAFVGILTGTETAYVSQEHELGRISFIDPETSSVTTITGFELNSQP
jgi:hypothetical protein